jgi:hypothetical protein
MEKSKEKKKPEQDMHDNDAFLEKDEVKKLRISYLKKISDDFIQFEDYARRSLESSGQTAVNDTHYATFHKVKGVGGTFGFPLLTEAAMEVLSLFTVKVKTETGYLDREKSQKLLEIVKRMKELVAQYKTQMGI